MKRFFSFVLSFFIFIPLYASYNTFGLSDSSEIRKTLIESWFEAPLSTVRLYMPEVYTNSVGDKFQVRLEEADDTFNIFVSPHSSMNVDVYSDKGHKRELQDVYIGDAPGSFVIVRDKKTGKPLRLRFYFASDADVFIQFIPNGRTCMADFIIFNSYVARGIPTGLKFERFYGASFDEIYKWTKDMLPWKYAKIYTDGYHSTKQMIEVIREKLNTFCFVPDAMYDEDGEAVYISTGKRRVETPETVGKCCVNGPGFLKWIGDGIVEPIVGGHLKREPLLTETVQYKPVGYQGILSESYSITFTLNWIRNLASALISIRTGKTYMYNNSGADVKVEPFTAEFTSKGIVNSLGYVHDTGYSTNVLRPLLYTLAITESETFYFAAISEVDHTSPEVKVFNECAVLFPYFDTKGQFKCVVFKDGSELDFDTFLHVYCNDFVYLTRARCTEEFFPE